MTAIIILFGWFSKAGSSVFGQINRVPHGETDLSALAQETAFIKFLFNRVLTHNAFKIFGSPNLLF